jgi:hypothetical protein
MNRQLLYTVVNEKITICSPRTHFAKGNILPYQSLIYFCCPNYIILYIIFIIFFNFPDRALARTRYRICNDIEDLMKRIIQQGETVKAHLLMIQVK